MKRLLLLITLFCFVFANAQERYEVTANSSLNIRDNDSYNSTVIGSLRSGEKVDVYETNGEWARILYDGQFAYINNKYLQKCNVEDIKEKKEKSFFNQLNVDRYATEDLWWMIFLILGLSIILSVFRKRRKNNDEHLSNKQYNVNLIVFVLTCIIEGVYFVNMGSSTIWFCDPSTIGWFAIAGFITFGWVVYNQIMCFLDTLIDIKYYAGYFDFRVGIYSCAIGVVALIIARMADWEDGYGFILSLLGVCQLIQIGLIIKGIFPNRGFFYSLLAVAVYLIGAIATSLILIQFIALLIIILIIGFFIMALFAGSSRSSSSSSSNEQRGYLGTNSNDFRFPGTFKDEDTFYGDDGSVYKREYGDKWRKI